MYNFTISKAWKHFCLVNKHKHYVFIASIEMGIPIRGLFHDVSKYSPSEFISSVKYYTGKRSPIDTEKEETGVSLAWLHHRGHNPHHWEFWYDNLSRGGEPLKIPIKYVQEMICDWIGSGKAYNGKNFTKVGVLQFFENKFNNKEIILHPDTYKLILNTLNLYVSEEHSLREAFNRSKINY